MPVQISNEILLQAARDYGTPLYVYHAEKIREQYEQLVSGFSILDTRFFYASKALTNISVLKYVKSIGCNIDCSSINEVKLALHAGDGENNDHDYCQEIRLISTNLIADQIFKIVSLPDQRGFSFTDQNLCRLITGVIVG